MLETVQTALTGADVYYWFIAGFGDVGHLAHSHYAPIDVPVTTAITSLIVQGYFCYRIWIMSRSWSRKTLWICWIIALVCFPDPSYILQVSDVFLNAERGYSSSRLCVGGYRSERYIHLRRNVLAHTAFSRS